MRDDITRSARAAVAVALVLPMAVAVGLGGARTAEAQVALPTSELPDGTAPYVTDVRSAPAYTRQPSDLECIDALTCIVGGDPPVRTVDGGLTWQRMRVVQPTEDVSFTRVDCPTTTRCIAVEPDGGILASADAGASWRQTASRTGVLDVTCTTASACVAVGRSAAGAFSVLSVDGGESWTAELPQPGSGLGHVECASTVFCVALGVTVATSTNGGRDWVERPAVTGDQYLSVDCADANTCLVLGATTLVAVHPATHASLTPPPILSGRPSSLSCGWSDRCLITGDRQFTRDNVVVLIDPATGAGGEVVLPAPIGEVVAMDCTAPRCTAIGGASGPMGNATQLAVTSTSIDRGSTWSTVLATARPEQYVDLTCTASPIAAETCLIVGGNGTQGDPAGLLDDLNEQGLILRTTDGGATWAPASVPAETRLLIDVDCAGTLCLASGFAADADRSAVLRSTDAGATWAVAPAPPSNSPSTVRCAEELECFVVVPAATPSQIYATPNGVDWTYRSPGSPSLTCTAGACFTNDAAGALLVSTDGAATWTPATTPPGTGPVTLLGCALLRCFATANAPVSSMESNDGGRSWSATSNSTISRISCVAGRCLAVASAGLALAAEGGTVVPTAPVVSLAWTPDSVLAFECVSRTRCLTLERTTGTARRTVRRIELLTPVVRPIRPARLLDTRPTGFTTDQRHQAVGLLPAGTTYRLDVRGRGGIAADATSANLNVTVTEPAADGFVTVYPCDRDRPTASNVNVRAGATVANAATVPIAADGTVCLYTWSTTHLVVDAAAYVPGGVAGWTALTPARLLDTRDGTVATTVDGEGRGGGPVAGNATYTLPVRGRGGVGTDATTVTATVTAIAPDGPGFVTVHPCNRARPTASNLNYAPGDVVANAVTVPIAPDGTICLYTLARTHLVVDVNAFAGPAAARVSALDPARLLDTRSGTGISTTDGQFLGIGPIGGAQYLTVRGRGGVPALARTAVLTVTATQARAPTFVTVWPCGTPLPTTSVVNVIPGQTVANTVVVDVTQLVCFGSPSPVDVVVDVNAYTL